MSAAIFLGEDGPLPHQLSKVATRGTRRDPSVLGELTLSNARAVASWSIRFWRVSDMQGGYGGSRMTAGNAVRKTDRHATALQHNPV